MIILVDFLFQDRFLLLSVIILVEYMQSIILLQILLLIHVCIFLNPFLVR